MATPAELRGSATVLVSAALRAEHALDAVSALVVRGVWVGAGADRFTASLAAYRAVVQGAGDRWRAAAADLERRADELSRSGPALGVGP